MNLGKNIALLIVSKWLTRRRQACDLMSKLSELLPSLRYKCLLIRCNLVICVCVLIKTTLVVLKEVVKKELLYKTKLELKTLRKSMFS